MPSLTRQQLDQMECSAPDCGHDHAVLNVIAQCHPDAYFAVSYDKKTGTVRVDCATCNTTVADFSVAA